MKLALWAIPAVALALAGCGPSAQQAPAPVVAAPAGPPPPSGVIAGALGASLSADDRQIASDAQVEALDRGERRSWKGKGGTFGYVEPGPQTGACRAYTQTVFIEGRAQSGQGQGCRQADGTWKL